MTDKLCNYEDAFSLVRDEVNNALTASPRIVRNYTEHLALSQGKNIRAMSLLTCSINRDGLISPSAVKLAAAIEILHLATLVHDDVIDDADIRRGLPTLQKKFGKRTAVICGDYLLSVALRKAASIPDKKDYLDMELPDYVMKICSGELLQDVNNGNYNLSVYQYLKIITGKTAALFEASFFAGAILSGCDRSELRLYKKMGRSLGMIFQLIDDCLDFEATENVAQKPVQSDFDKKVITLPIIQAFRKNTGLKEKALKNEVTKEELNKAVFDLGGLSFTRMVAKRYYARYMKILDSLETTEDKHNGLERILNKAFRVFQSPVAL
jgi:heptaprenyl diphosphate synthase